MNKKLLILVIIISLNIRFTSAQIGVGEWRDHLPFVYSIAVTQSPSKVYVASENGVFSYSKKNQNIEKLTKVNILSDVGVSSIAYSDENSVLAVGYSNGNLDLVFDNEVFNLSDIKREMISGSKSINHILFIDEYAYLSCGFGIVVINVQKREVKDTYYIGNFGGLLQVNQLVLSNNYLYAATNEGVFIADYTNYNLADYSNWQIITAIPNYTSKFNAIYVDDNNNLLVNQSNDLSNDILFAYSEGAWMSLNSDYSTIREIKNENSAIQIVSNRNILSYSTDFVFIDSISQIDIPKLDPFDVVFSDNTYWIADKGKGLVKFTAGSFESITPNAPYLPESFSIDIDNNRVLVTAGSLTPSWGNSFFTGAAFSFRNERWESMFNFNAFDYVSVKIDPYNTEHFYAGSWGGGLVEYLNNELVETYKVENSTLRSIIPGSNYYRIGGLDFDSDNNLWITNSDVENPISVKKSNDGDWLSFNFEEKISNIRIGKIIVTQNDNKWVVLPSGNGLFVFDNNQTIDDINDDLFKKISIVDENGKIISNNVYSIAEDLDGDIWVGIDQGIVVYYNSENVFEDSDFHAQRIVITIGEATDFLLKTETITAIAVDGANRKWIGTNSSGVYLVSEDGIKEINHFTEENSPLLSNKIKDVGINHETGEVFIATDKGLISYRGTATMGSDEFRDVYVYPNPVRENYYGDITVRGLVSDVNVKITDISGNIVYETTADGGQATWNGKNFSGKRVSTGVYLVFCSNEDGSKTYITKLLFIK
ncbi:MAG: T9SS type A sorting domain-containing protein [Bacteroidales bacterium]|jgi:hypothetical protein|nr:T9SS type A sorting domain-containing protein [Bacteroidales bacterium]